MDFDILSTSYIQHSGRYSEEDEAKGLDIPCSESLTFEITSSGIADIWFDDGSEIKRSVFRRDRNSSAKLTILKNQNDDRDEYQNYSPNYIKISKFNSFIEVYLQFSMKKTAFENIVKFLRNGENPTSVYIDFLINSSDRDAVMSFSSSPGSYDWNPSKGDRSKINGVNFEFKDILDNSINDYVPLNLQKNKNYNIREINNKLKIITAEIKEIKKLFYYVFGFTYLFLIGYFFSR